MVTTLGAIAEPNRFEIVEFLRDGPRSVNEIAERLQLRQPQVSKHLRVLSDAGLVEKHPRAQLRIYALRAQPFEELNSWVGTFKSLWNERLDTLDEYLHEAKAKQKRESTNS